MKRDGLEHRNKMWLEPEIIFWFTFLALSTELGKETALIQLYLCEKFFLQIRKKCSHNLLPCGLSPLDLHSPEKVARHPRMSGWLKILITLGSVKLGESACHSVPFFIIREKPGYNYMPMQLFQVRNLYTWIYLPYLPWIYLPYTWNSVVNNRSLLK